MFHRKTAHATHVDALLKMFARTYFETLLPLNPCTFTNEFARVLSLLLSGTARGITRKKRKVVVKVSHSRAEQLGPQQESGARS